MEPICSPAPPDALDFRQSRLELWGQGRDCFSRTNPAFDTIKAEFAKHHITAVIEAMGSDGPLLVLSIRHSSPPPLVVPQNIAARLGVQFDTVRARGRTVLVVWR
jgi:hypothetical protein